MIEWANNTREKRRERSLDKMKSKGMEAATVDTWDKLK